MHVSFQTTAYVSFGLTCKGGIAGSPWPPDARSWLIGKDPNAGKDRGQDEKRAAEDEMVSLTQWTWAWANSGRQFRRGKPGVLWFMESQRVGHDLATE